MVYRPKAKVTSIKSYKSFVIVYLKRFFLIVNYINNIHYIKLKLFKKYINKTTLVLGIYNRSNNNNI